MILTPKCAIRRLTPCLYFELRDVISRAPLVTQMMFIASGDKCKPFIFSRVKTRATENGRRESVGGTISRARGGDGHLENAPREVPSRFYRPVPEKLQWFFARHRTMTSRVVRGPVSRIPYIRRSTIPDECERMKKQTERLK